MRTLQDISALCEGEYGLNAIRNTFHAHKTTNFYGAAKEWKGILELCDDLIVTHHRLDPKSNTLQIPEIPVIMAFRQAYECVLRSMPGSIEECQTALDNMTSTLQAISSLDDVIPFEREDENTSTMVQRIRASHIEQKHISNVQHSIVDVATKTAERWTARRQKDKHPIQPWNERTFVQTLLGRVDIVGRRLYPNGNNHVLGYYILKDEMCDDLDHLELIDCGAVGEPGVSDVLASDMLLQLKSMSQKKILNTLEKYH